MRWVDISVGKKLYATFCTFILFFLIPVAFVYTLLFWLLLGMSFALLVDALLLRDVFDRLEGNVRQKSRPR